MPIDEYLVRFANDDEGREVNNEQIVPTAAVPWPPHPFVAMAVAVEKDKPPEERNHSVAVLIHPNNEATYADYAEHLAAQRARITLVALAMFPNLDSVGLTWFTRVKTSPLTDEQVDHPHIMRGALYRPATHAEVELWAGPETAAIGVEVVINS